MYTHTYIHIGICDGVFKDARLDLESVCDLHWYCMKRECACVCVCVYVCMHACMCVCVCVCVCVYVCICMCVYAYMYACVCICMYTYVCSQWHCCWGRTDLSLGSSEPLNASCAVGVTDDDTCMCIYVSLGVSIYVGYIYCLLYTSPSPRDRQKSRMPSSA